MLHKETVEPRTLELLKRLQAEPVPPHLYCGGPEQRVCNAHHGTHGAHSKRKEGTFCAKRKKTKDERK